MATLEEKLRAELTTALKARDLKTANLIRMLSTNISQRRTAKDFTGVVDDALVLDVLQTYKKSMEKARAEYAALGERGAEQVVEMDFEIGWIKPWLPQQLTEAELRAAIAEVVAALPAKDPKLTGKVIGMIKKAHGDKADAAMTKAIAEELLRT